MVKVLQFIQISYENHLIINNDTTRAIGTYACKGSTYRAL